MSDAPAPPPTNPADRQVLVAIGNRYVLFDRGAALRGSPRLGPADVARPLPRTPEPREGVEARIVQSLVVHGSQVRGVEGRDSFTDRTPCLRKDLISFLPQSTDVFRRASKRRPNHQTTMSSRK